jgi:hypothetical protein
MMPPNTYILVFSTEETPKNSVLRQDQRIYNSIQTHITYLYDITGLNVNSMLFKFVNSVKSLSCWSKGRENLADIETKMFIN